MAKLEIRVARPGDAGGMLAIYGPYIEHTSYTFETELPTIEAFAGRIRQHLEYWPWLVAMDGEVVAGYAYAGRYRERTGYQWCVESSVYIHPAYRQRGLAARLYKLLFQILKKQGYRNVYAVINTPNDPSVAFHEKAGFRFFAMYEQVGWKLGAWKNVGWWRLVLNDFPENPSAPQKFSEMEEMDLFPGK